MGRLSLCSLESVFTKRIWTVLFLFSSVIVSSKDGSSEGNTRSTTVSTFRLSSGMDREGSSSMIDVSADHNGVSTGFSTSDQFGKSFLYPGGSRNGEIGRSSKTLLASSRKGQWWTVWLPSHSLQGNLRFPFCPETSLSLVDGVFSTWSSKVDDTKLCKRGDQSLKIWGMQGQSRW